MTLSERARMRLVEAHRIGHMREVASLLRQSLGYRGCPVATHIESPAEIAAKPSAVERMLRFARLRKVA